MAIDIDRIVDKSGQTLMLADAASRARLDQLEAPRYLPGGIYLSKTPATPHIDFGGEWEYQEDNHMFRGWYVYIKQADATENEGEVTS